MSIGRRLSCILGGCALSVTLLVAGATSAAAATNATCAGGTVAPGIYRSLTITGFCMLNGGNVTVQRDVRITSTGGLNATFANSQLTVGRDLRVESGGLLGLGCDPVESPCSDNPAATTKHRIGRNLIANAPTLMVVHDNRIGARVEQRGGGGFSCAPVLPNGPPGFTDYAYNIIGGSATVTGLKTCWAGFSHNHVGGSVTYSQNQTAITPDGNLIDGNQIGESLSCFENAPNPHLSDAHAPVKNVVGDEARGQCAAISVSAD